MNDQNKSSSTHDGSGLFSSQLGAKSSQEPTRNASVPLGTRQFHSERVGSTWNMSVPLGMCQFHSGTCQFHLEHVGSTWNALVPLRTHQLHLECVGSIQNASVPLGTHRLHSEHVGSTSAPHKSTQQDSAVSVFTLIFVTTFPAD